MRINNRQLCVWVAAGRARADLLEAVQWLLSDDVRREQLHELGTGVGGMGSAIGVEHIADNQHCSTRQHITTTKNVWLAPPLEHPKHHLDG